MMKFLTVSVLTVVSGLAFSQGDPVSLGVAKPVDIHVTQVDWQPTGRALIYQREEEKGIGLGVYTSSNFEGKIVLHLRKDENEETYWLSDSKAALVVVHSPALEAKTKSTQIRIYLVNADTQTARELFKETFDSKVLPSVDVDISPSLEHAIVTFRNSQGSYHKVLTIGGGNLSDSPDLDRAEKEGMSGPTWSVDGTAIYANGTGSKADASERFVRAGGSDGVAGTITFIADDSKGATSTVGITLTGTDSAEIYSTALSSLVFRLKISPPMPKTGATVMELMPSNAILRPIRFRGPWVTSNKVGANLVPQNQSLVLHFDQSNAQDTSVWLSRGNQKGAPAALVAVHVTDTWLPEVKSGVAYTIDGALFFRSIGN